MASPLSTLGIVHTMLSLIPVCAGAYGLLRLGRIPPQGHLGNVYGYGLLGAVLTSFGLSSSGGFNSGHAIGILALAALLLGRQAMRLQRLGQGRAYLETASMSFSFLLLMIPGLNESLSRLPPSAPIGNGPDSPEVQLAMLVALLHFLAGLGYQCLRLRAARQAAATALQPSQEEHPA
jgi:hypothetical protein